MKVVIAVVVGLAASVLAVPAASELLGRSSATARPPASVFLPRNGGMIGPQQAVFFGYPKSLARSGGSYRMRVDPALVLSGVTAYDAAVADHAIRPGEAVPDDYYTVNETRRLLTYRVPATARVTVITNPGAGPRSTVVSVVEFSAILQGKNPRQRPGMWAPASGFWIRVAGDRSLAIDQAYRP